MKKKIKEAALNMLNESYYCNGAGQNASSHPGCREHGAACINWGEGVAGTMGQNVNDPDDWQCVPNELNVGTGGTGGGPLSGDDLVVKTKGGNTKPSINPNDGVYKLKSANIMKEAELRKYSCYTCKGGFWKGNCVHNASILAPYGQRPSDCQSLSDCNSSCTRRGSISQSDDNLKPSIDEMMREAAKNIIKKNG
jgi:hypothetical protein